MLENGIAIFGMYKTGTTAIFSNILNSLDSDPRLLFEAEAYNPLPGDAETGVLCKVILGSPTVQYDSFNRMAKKISIIRDPRDWLISGMLFIIQESSTIINDDEVYKRIFNLLLKKENDPISISLNSILSEILKYTPLKNMKAFLDWVRSIHTDVISFNQSLQDGYLLRYEDFIDRNIFNLNNYLGITLNTNVSVNKHYSHVPRSLNYDNWKHWLTEEDVSIFKDSFAPYLRHYVYDLNWELESNPIILTDHCTKYVDRIIKRKRTLLSLNKTQK